MEVKDFTWYGLDPRWSDDDSRTLSLPLRREISSVVDLFKQFPIVSIHVTRLNHTYILKNYYTF